MLFFILLFHLFYRVVIFNTLILFHFLIFWRNKALKSFGFFIFIVFNFHIIESIRIVWLFLYRLSNLLSIFYNRMLWLVSAKYFGKRRYTSIFNIFFLYFLFLYNIFIRRYDNLMLFIWKFYNRLISFV